MKPEEFAMLCSNLVENIRSVSPIKTGNLRYNAIKYEFIDEKTCKIYVDESIAPYMPYTNEPWVSDKWKGAKNPNEGWWQNKALPKITSTIEQMLAKEFIRSKKGQI